MKKLKDIQKKNHKKDQETVWSKEHITKGITDFKVPYMPMFGYEGIDEHILGPNKKNWALIYETCMEFPFYQ